jgi:hypothetical protein
MLTLRFEISRRNFGQHILKEPTKHLIAGGVAVCESRVELTHERRR